MPRWGTTQIVKYCLPNRLYILRCSCSSHVSWWFLLQCWTVRHETTYPQQWLDTFSWWPKLKCKWNRSCAGVTESPLFKNIVITKARYYAFHCPTLQKYHNPSNSSYFKSGCCIKVAYIYFYDWKNRSYCFLYFHCDPSCNIKLLLLLLLLNLLQRVYREKRSFSTTAKLRAWTEHENTKKLLAFIAAWLWMLETWQRLVWKVDCFIHGSVFLCMMCWILIIWHTHVVWRISIICGEDRKIRGLVLITAMELVCHTFDYINSTFLQIPTSPFDFDFFI